MNNFARPKKFSLKNASIRFGNKSLSQWSESSFHDNFFLFLGFLWILPLALATIYTAINFQRLPDEIPLFYSRVWGQAQLASSPGVYLPLLSAFIIGLVNLIISIGLHSRDKLIAYFLTGSAVLVSFLASITVFNIVHLFS